MVAKWFIETIIRLIQLLEGERLQRKYVFEARKVRLANEKLIVIDCEFFSVATEDHITVTFTHVEVNVDAIEDDGCTIAFIEIHEGESLDGPSRGKWCDNVIPLPLTSNGNALTVHLYASYDFFGHFAIMYSVLNSGKRLVRGFLERSPFASTESRRVSFSMFAISTTQPR